MVIGICPYETSGTKQSFNRINLICLMHWSSATVLMRAGQSSGSACGDPTGHLRETFCGCGHVTGVRPVLVLYLYLCEEQHALDLW